jgi:hypothetical protein
VVGIVAEPPIQALLRAARDAAVIARACDEDVRGPSIFRGVHSNSGAHLLQALEEAGWTLVEKGELDARDEHVLDLEAEVRRLEERERQAEQRVIAGKGSHQDTALVAIKLGEDLLEARTAISDHLANLCPGGSPRLYVETVERLKAIVEVEGGGEHA